jgi:hypothetical protein
MRSPSGLWQWLRWCLGGWLRRLVVLWPCLGVEQLLVSLGWLTRTRVAVRASAAKSEEQAESPANRVKAAWLGLVGLARLLSNGFCIAPGSRNHELSGSLCLMSTNRKQ